MATCLLMLADVAHFGGRYCLRQEIPPVASDDRKQGSYIHQFIILAGYMGVGTAPNLLFRFPNQFRPNRIVLSIIEVPLDLKTLNHPLRFTLSILIGSIRRMIITTVTVRSTLILGNRPWDTAISNTGWMIQ